MTKPPKIGRFGGFLLKLVKVDTLWNIIHIESRINQLIKLLMGGVK